MFTLKIETGNAAFEPAGPELARILRKLADEVENIYAAGDRGGSGTLRDFNGNTVGTYWYLPEEVRA